jgi:hypothetical protein
MGKRTSDFNPAPYAPGPKPGSVWPGKLLGRDGKSADSGHDVSAVRAAPPVRGSGSRPVLLVILAAHSILVSDMESPIVSRGRSARHGPRAPRMRSAPYRQRPRSGQAPVRGSGWPVQGWRARHHRAVQRIILGRRGNSAPPRDGAPGPRRVHPRSWRGPRRPGRATCQTRRTRQGAHGGGAVADASGMAPAARVPAAIPRRDDVPYRRARGHRPSDGVAGSADPHLRAVVHPVEQPADRWQWHVDAAV